MSDDATVRDITDFLPGGKAAPGFYKAELALFQSIAVRLKELEERQASQAATIQELEVKLAAQAERLQWLLAGQGAIEERLDDAGLGQ